MRGVAVVDVKPKSSRSKRRTMASRLASPCAACIDRSRRAGSFKSSGSSVELTGESGAWASIGLGGEAARAAAGGLVGANGWREEGAST